jgi:serine/threonine protein kinase
VTAGLELAGIPAVYDTGEEIAPDGSSRIWLVMQLLDGKPLADLLFHEDFPPAQESEPESPWCSIAWAAAIGAQIAAVLADVHRVNIVHRDIKPANVMITAGGIVKVLDFGIAILHGNSATPRLTQFDRTVGTPAYMSPEQNLGKLVTAESDIYSLGCLLFEVLTGDKPFLATPSMPMRAHHVQTPPPSPLRQRPTVPKAIDELVIAMMAKDPSLRPTASDVYEALLPFTLAGPGIVNALAGDRDPTRPFRRPLLSVPSAADGDKATPVRHSPSSGPLTDSEADAVRDRVRELLDDSHPMQAVSLLDDAVERAHDPALKLQMREELAATLFYVGEYARAATVFVGVRRDYARLRGDDDPLVLNYSYYAGQAYAEAGQPEVALRYLRAYVRKASQTQPARRSPEEALQILESRFRIATLLVATGNPEEALAELRGIRPQFVAIFGESSTMVRNIDRQITRLTR